MARTPIPSPRVPIGGACVSSATWAVSVQRYLAGSYGPRMRKPSVRVTNRVGIFVSRMPLSSASHPPSGPVRLNTTIPSYPRAATASALSVNTHTPRSTTAIGAPTAAGRGTDAGSQARPTKAVRPLRRRRAAPMRGAVVLVLTLGLAGADRRVGRALQELDLAAGVGAGGYLREQAERLEVLVGGQEPAVGAIELRLVGVALGADAMPAGCALGVGGAKVGVADQARVSGVVDVELHVAAVPVGGQQRLSAADALDRHVVQERGLPVDVGLLDLELVEVGLADQAWPARIGDLHDVDVQRLLVVDHDQERAAPVLPRERAVGLVGAGAGGLVGKRAIAGAGGQLDAVAAGW